MAQEQENQGGNWMDRVDRFGDVLIKGSEVYGAWQGARKPSAGDGQQMAPAPQQAGIGGGINPMLVVGGLAVAGVAFWALKK